MSQIYQQLYFDNGFVKFIWIRVQFDFLLQEILNTKTWFQLYNNFAGSVWKFWNKFWPNTHMTTTAGVLDYTSPLGTDENVNERLFS